MSWTLYVPFCQRSRISRSSFFPVKSGDGAPSQSVVSLAPASVAFVLFTAWPAKMSGLLRTCEEVKVLPARYATPSWSSLCCAVTRLSLLQSRVWQIVNLALQPSHFVGRSGGSSPYHRKRASWNYCAPSSVIFNVDGWNVSQALVLIPCHSQRARRTGAPSSVTTSASSARCWLLFRKVIASIFVYYVFDAITCYPET